MDSPSLEGFHTQLDCKLMNGNKNQTQVTLIQYIKLSSKQTEQNRNDKKYSQSGRTVIIHANHDSFRATAILQRSMVVSSEFASEASLRNYIDCPSGEQLRACSDVLSDALSGEGHISYCNQVLQLCHPQQSSCSSVFGCRSFIKLALSSLFTMSCEKTLVFLSATIRPDFTEHFTSTFCIRD